MPCEATIWMWPDDALGRGRYPVDLSTAATMTINRHPMPASPRSVPATIVLLIAFVVGGCGTVVSVDAEDVRDAFALVHEMGKAMGIDVSRVGALAC